MVESREFRLINALPTWGPGPVTGLALSSLPGEVGIKVVFVLPAGAVVNGYSHATISLAIGDSTDFQQVAEVKWPGTMAKVTKRQTILVLLLIDTPSRGNLPTLE